MTDEELARKLAVEMEREERERRAAQEKADAAMARTMMNTDEKSIGKNAGGVDARGERGKWNVKQPPNVDQAPANSDAGVEDSSDGAFEPYLSKKARRRRNKRLNLEKTSTANEQVSNKQLSFDGEQGCKLRIISRSLRNRTARASDLRKRNCRRRKTRKPLRPF